MTTIRGIHVIVKNIDSKILDKSLKDDAATSEIKRVESKVDGLGTLIGRLHFEMLIQSLTAGGTASAALYEFLDSKFGIRSIEDFAGWTDDATSVEQQVQQYYNDKKIDLTAPTASMIGSVRAKARTAVGKTGPAIKKK